MHGTMNVKKKVILTFLQSARYLIVIFRVIKNRNMLQMFLLRKTVLCFTVEICRNFCVTCFLHSDDESIGLLRKVRNL